MDCAIANTIAEVLVLAKAGSVRLVVDIGASEVGGLCEHVVDAGLLAKGKSAWDR